MDPRRELIDLLLKLFDPERLRQWVRLALGEEMHHALPGTSVGFDILCFQLVQQAEQRGLIDESFFEKLIEERPRQAKRIDAVAAQWLDGRRAPSTNAPLPLPAGSRMPMARNPLFVGRADDLRKLVEALQVGSTAAIGQVASVTGLGGLGKTQLAVEFVYRYGQLFTGGVFWLSFADPESVRTEIAQCGGPKHLNLWSIQGAPDIDTQVDTITRIFAGPEPRLLVFDNCEDEKLLAEWRPKTGGSRVLATSRRSTFSAHLGVRTLPLDVLPRAESLALLRVLAHEQPFEAADEATLDAICAELGDLPLALHLAGSFLARYRSAVTPAAYLAQLRSPALLDHPSLQGHGAGSSPTGHVQHVGKTFALSWDRLDPAHTVDALARDLLQRAACLAPGEPIPEELLLATLGKPEAALDVTLARADALRRLLDLGLLEKPDPGTYRIHLLVTHFAQRTNGDHTAARAAVEQTLLYAANRVNDSGFPARLLPWQPHLRAVTDAARMREDELAASLCNALGYHLHAIGDYLAARPYWDRARALHEKLLGPEHPNTAASLNNLAGLLQRQGALDEARPLHERAFAIREKQLGPEHPDTAISLNNLAGLLQAQGALDEARPLFERALAIREKQRGPEHPDTAISLNNLAGVLRAQGAITEARSLHERALAINEKQLGPEHPDTALSLTNLAFLLQTQEALDEARPLLERALAIHEKQLGPGHPHTAWSLNNLGGLFHEQGALAEARPLFERALAIHTKQLGPEHPLTVGSLNNLARLLHDQGALAEARPLYERALAIREKQLGLEHPDTVWTLSHLAALLKAQGALAEARPLYERALATCEKQLGPEHPDTATSMNNLAGLLQAQGAFAEARPLVERARAICEAKLGPDHPTTRIVRGNLKSLPKPRARRRSRRRRR
jgi:tetratricopeptide (TPR) repeat protein